MMRLLHGIALLAVLALVGLPAGAEETELVDQVGRTVWIEQPVERVASVYGAGTFIVYSLGAAERLARAWYIGVKGIAQADDSLRRFEPRLAEILAFGDPNVEEMVARGIDLALVDGARHGAFADQMGDVGIPVLQYRTESPDGLRDAMRLTGAALGPAAAARATAFLADYDRILSMIQTAVAECPDEARVRVLFVGTEPLRVASGDMYQTFLIEAAGGRSVTERLSGYWNDVNLEQVLRWNPDVILIPPYGTLTPRDFLENPDWQAVRAVRDRRVHRMPRVIGPWDTPIPESILGVVWMAELFYPGQIPVDLATEVAHFYATYYGHPLTDEEWSHLTGR